MKTYFNLDCEQALPVRKVSRTILEIEILLTIIDDVCRVEYLEMPDILCRLISIYALSEEQAKSDWNVSRTILEIEGLVYIDVRNRMIYPNIWCDDIY